MSSAIPHIVRVIADTVPVMHVRQAIDRRLGSYSGGPPPDYLERENVRRMAAELEGHVKHAWSYDHRTDRNVLTSKISKPLSYAELISLLSRAYQAGLDGR